MTFNVYIKEIRLILEFSCPVWSGSLTIRDSEEIEKVQKTEIKEAYRVNIHRNRFK